MSLPRIGSVLEPLQLRSAGEQMSERLATAIALGEFVPGQRLPSERVLAENLGVSRRTVREALHRLAADGYVEIGKGRYGGAVVISSWGPASAEFVRRTLTANWASFEWLFDLRRLIEPLIARTAAERRDASDVEAITAAQVAYLAAGDRDASRAADADLHRAIGSATKNPYLADIGQQLRAEVTLGFRAEPYSPEIRARAIDQHAQLVAAIVGQRADDAAAIAAEHFQLTERAMRELVGRVEWER